MRESPHLRVPLFQEIRAAPLEPVVDVNNKPVSAAPDTVFEKVLPKDVGLLRSDVVAEQCNKHRNRGIWRFCIVSPAAYLKRPNGLYIAFDISTSSGPDDCFGLSVGPRPERALGRQVRPILIFPRNPSTIASRLGGAGTAAAKRAQRPGSVAARFMVRARAAGSAMAKWRPSVSWVTRSAIAPASEQITGLPNIQASEITSTKASHQIDGTMHQSMRPMRWRSSAVS